MTYFNRYGSISALAAMLTLAACGGGGGDSSTDTTSQSATGPITSFGSIYVNGIEYDTDAADIYIEDELADESDLRVGMVVTIHKDNSGGAASVHFDDDIEGIVLANNFAANGTLDIMGQTVTVTNETIFESKVAGVVDAATIAVGNVVEVSGYSTGTGAVTATRLEVKAVDLASYLAGHPEGIELKGVVEGHTPASSTFSIGNLTIDYTGADLSDVGGAISNGMYVEVKSTQGLNGAGHLVASEVELEDDGEIGHHGEEDDEYELYGKVMAMDGDTITVNHQVVLITDETEFDDGVRSDLAIGTMVEVEGHFDAAGNLVAEEIEFEENEDTNEVNGTVDTVVTSAPNVGTVTLTDGTVIKVNEMTIMHDSQDEGMTPDTNFNLADLMSGDYVEVHMFSNDDGTFTATKLERDDMPSSP